ncbi:DUF4350 domain-containing protein [Conyzicola nivalis]|uniref:DUF4350 domain-containing protein n=1 Tax=Conyzicola nivalis TaxID=1477021 RepID=A0A916SK10_9MICO|nr:hypothetical protein GCM10010979_17460 [Conyzicola nivalis]
MLTASTTTVLRRSAFWAAAAVFAIVIALVGILFAGAVTESDPLSPTNPAPGGAKAVVEVLRQQGVTVTAASTLERATDAITDAADTTLFFYDPDGILEGEQLTEAFALAGNVVAVEPDFDQLLALTPDVAQAGTVDGEVEADCDLTAATRAGSITGDGSGYRYLGDDPVATTCFGSGDDVYSLVRVPTETGSATIVGAADALSNEFVTDRGNAAFALGLLGETDNLVWYTPSAADLSTEAPPTLGELSPDWVLPGTALVVLTALAAAFWRGRRFGPLIIENLPVTVRANETMQGRARLYQKSAARLRALDSLRIGTVQRIAALCGLSRLAAVDEVAATAAAVAGLQPTDVRRILLDAVPTTDRELVRLSDQLLTLERTVATSVTPV